MTATTEPATDNYLLTVLRRTFPDYATWETSDSISVDRAAFARLMQLCRGEVAPAKAELRMVLDEILTSPSFLAEADKVAAAQFWEQSGNIGHLGSSVVHLMRVRIRAALFG